MEQKKSKGFLEDYPDVLKMEHICEITGETRATIRRAVIEGQLQGHKIGRRWFFSKQALAKMLGAGD